MSGEPILLVDDSTDSVDLICAILEREGYEIRVAEDAVRAAQYLDYWRPKLILMDIQLPGMDGLRFTRRLRQNRALQDVNIVAITAYARKGDEEYARSAGCDGYIKKPIDTQAFPSVIRRYLERSYSVRGPILIADDDENYRSLLRHQLEALDYDVLEADGGAKALRILAGERVPLVILDIVMPDIEGLETVLELRRQHVRTKVVVVSGADRASQYLEVAQRLGADAAFEKSCPMSGLLALVGPLLRQAREHATEACDGQ